MTFLALEAKGILTKAVAACFFFATLTYFITPVTDVDFPWHLKTGEYIWQQKEIPETDPFSVFSSGSQTEKFILSQYWLAQLFFHFQYRLGGIFGIILLRSAIFTGLVMVLWFSMKRTPLLLKTLLLYGCVILLHFYSNDRPQYFSFFFGAAVVALLVRHGRASGRTIFALPFMMMIWANMHGGFIFGDVAIAVFCLGEAAAYFMARRSPQPLPPARTLMLAAVGLVSILASYLNPNTYHAFSFAVDSVAAGGAQGIREYMSPISETLGAFATKYNFIYWAIVGYSFVVLALNLRRLVPAHAGLILFAFALSLSASRFVPFFVSSGLIVSGQYGLPLDKLDRNALFGKIKGPATALALALVVFWCGSLVYARASLPALNRWPATAFFPEKAVGFLLDNFSGENLFTSRNTGSYFLWRLSPKFRTFIDTRALDQTVAGDYSTIVFATKREGEAGAYLDALNDLLPAMRGTAARAPGPSAQMEEQWDLLLRRYGMDVIVHEATNFFSGMIYPLTLRLIKDDRWELVYSDGDVMIFVRDIPRYSELIAKRRLAKEKIYDEIGIETIRQIGKSRHAPVYSSLAFALAMKGGSEDAIAKMIKHATYLDPNDLQTSVIEAFIVAKKHAR